MEEKWEGFTTEGQRLFGKYGANGVGKSLYCNHNDKDRIRQILLMDVKCKEKFWRGTEYLHSPKVSPRLFIRCRDE